MAVSRIQRAVARPAVAGTLCIGLALAACAPRPAPAPEPEDTGEPAPPPATPVVPVDSQPLDAPGG